MWEPSRMRRYLGGAAAIIAAILASPIAALAQSASAPASAPAQPIKDGRALQVLKGMSETLARAKTLGFSVRGIVPVPAPTGQYVSLLGASRVMMQRPDKLFVESRGDLFPSDLYYNGKTVTAIGAEKKFYAQRDVSGNAVTEAMQAAEPGGDAVAPFFDLLVTDPYAHLTKDYTTALWVGRSSVGGVACDHVAMTAKDVDWELWVGVADKLPRMLLVASRSGDRQPTFTAEFSNWKLDVPMRAKTFEAAIPKGAVKIEFKPQRK